MKKHNKFGKKEISLSVIEKGLRDSDWRVRTAAMNACQGKDVPLEVIEKGLRDSDGRVRLAAMNWCKDHGSEIPVTRTFEPPEKVYKKCAAGVIVVAHIPADAHVRGTPNGKCRASKAEIVDIIGDFYGEKVGISLYDGSVWYFAGDEIEIEDFDFSNAECSQGFHFFCTLEQAQNYNA